MGLFLRKGKLFCFEKWLPYQCVQCYAFDIQRYFEKDNRNADSLDYIVFQLDWVVKVVLEANIDLSDFSDNL